MPLEASFGNWPTVTSTYISLANTSHVVTWDADGQGNRCSLRKALQVMGNGEGREKQVCRNTTLVLSIEE